MLHFIIQQLLFCVLKVGLRLPIAVLALLPCCCCHRPAQPPKFCLLLQLLSLHYDCGGSHSMLLKVLKLSCWVVARPLLLLLLHSC